MTRSLPRRPLTLLMISPVADRLHMGLMMGATAAATGRPVTYFFSKGAVRFLAQGGWESLQTEAGVPAPEMDVALDAKGIADSNLLLEGLSALNARFVACETALREYDIDTEGLLTRPPVEISGLADILEKGEGGDWLTF